MYRLIIQNFVRSKIAVAALALLLLAGIVSVVTGKQFLDRQDRIIEEVRHAQKETLSRNAGYFSHELGLMMYHSRFAIVNTPSRLSAVSVGQRDVNPTVLTLTIRGLEAQLYDTDLNNPYNQLSGNLDLGFVIIYLFPLLIIAFSYSLLSDEKEGGTWKLVSVNAGDALGYLFQKLLVRLVIVCLCLIILWSVAIVALRLPIDSPLLSFVGLSFLYVLFWFAVCLLVISCKRSSAFNALALLAIWIVLAVLLPAMTNNYVSGKYPVPEALGTMLKQRDAYHEKFDMDKQATVDKFYLHYPQYKKYILPDKPFSYLWYYAMQQMGDDESAPDSKAFRSKLVEREKASRSLAYFIPTMHAQLQFNDLARTSLSDHLLFLETATRFHKKMRLHFYDKIFAEETVAAQDWSRFTPESFTGDVQGSGADSFFPILFLTAAIIGIAIYKMRTNEI